MRVSVLGVGSIGSIVAASLATTAAEVHLHVRGERGAKHMLEGLRIEGHNDLNFEAERFLFSCEELPHDVALNQGSDLVILACKSYDVAHMAQQASAFLKSDGIAFALSNGLGHVETLARTLGPERVLAASTTHGAFMQVGGPTRWAGFGALSLATTPLGPSSAQVAKVVDLLNDAQLNAVVESDPTALIWNKVMLNVAINPLAALGGLKNGELLEPDLFATCMMVYREASAVAIMERVDVPDEHEFEQRLRTVLEQTRENTCSMLQDVKAGRRTEIEALNQAVVERAEHHGLAAPINQMLASLVRACHP